MSEGESELSSLSLEFVEGLYEEYAKNPNAVPADWRRYFENFENGAKLRKEVVTGPRFKPPGVFNPRGGNGAARPAPAVPGNGHLAQLQYELDRLVRNYRVRGHVIARLNPLGEPGPIPPELDVAKFDISEADLDRRLHTFMSEAPLSVREILDRLQNTYCRSIGVHFMHIDDLEVREWLQEKMERTENRLELSRDEQVRIFTRLSDATAFEEFIQKKFIGAKSFSLEGAESLIPLLDMAIERAGDSGIEEIVIGMPHRGRINVLANIMGKDPKRIFQEFEDKNPEHFEGRGDVKYHLGSHTEWETQSGKTVHLALCFNPSHLEFVNPVALGRTRAHQDRTGDKRRDRSMAILLHGDAAFAGEGIVQETLNMSQLKAYSTGGTLHVIINNQIGFTTLPREGRSSPYASDIAKLLQIPIFHVNGEDPEAVAQAVYLASEFRMAFKRDVVIDMYCYRRRGHNETDEPEFTQPRMYSQIKKRESVSDSYLEQLLRMGGMTRDEAKQIEKRRRKKLNEALQEAREAEEVRPPSALRGLWRHYKGGADRDVPEVDTGIEDKARLKRLLKATTNLPEGFHLHSKLEKLRQIRLAMANEEQPLDWSAAEALAFATLATDGHPVRFTGQDSVRGTFSQRHSALTDVETGKIHRPLVHLEEGQAPIEIYNSPLNEAGVLGFEYGYSIAYPDGLVLWEAQFGDFVNAAQVIIDQFITSAEDKWRSLSGIVLLLPHGFEGMGPEHSSGRMERFLSLAAEDNIQVINPTTPVQYFHALRRQVVRKWRKPLIVMTPKSLLRHDKCVSTLDEFTHGRFQRILPDEGERVDGVSRILMCSGKMYYDLAKAREENERDDVAILRVEQLYPLQPTDLFKVLEPYAPETKVIWVQEEPENMGAWRRMKGKFGQRLLDRFPFTVVSRAASASPATGSASAHKREQQELVDRAFGDQPTSWF